MSRLLILRTVSGALSRTTQHRVYSALFLAGSFVFSGRFLYRLGLQWFRFLYVMLYVGRIAVLFLFVLMSLEKGTEPVTKARGSKFLSVARCAVVLVSIPFFHVSIPARDSLGWDLAMDTTLGQGGMVREGVEEVSMPKVIRNMLYVQWREGLLLMGAILVLGMVGAITMRALIEVLWSWWMMTR
jgi:NADH:ubiquinone oxidoreductase subunit 6 (subunit J)